ncbi:cytochrome d ubiquinol oxidase subunit II [Halospeciosus flavus]|uniref:Cytochrome d ubiquinol oxidase subunit II n=1 Tax=Halospeciosus flavus TaxID=3032283 RepID=A0ABD5Z0U1_9EURY|nr:cytochrome d ubiquinol oxidase subunit II [Halospeciosus flavus]
MTSGLAAGPLFGLPLADLWFALTFAILGAFLFLDGFDFGVGALFVLRDDDHEREQLLAVVGPFWDGNEVWLVVFGGVLFAVFPSVYAALFTRYYLLMFAILAALILRGLAPEMYEQRHDETWQRWWGRSFVVGSVAAPFFLGTFVGLWLFGAPHAFSPRAALVGVAVVALTVVDGVAFTRLKVRGDLRDALRPYGVWSAVAYLVLAVAVLATVGLSAPSLRQRLLSPLGLGLVVLTVLLTAGYVVATRRDRYYAAFASVAGLVFGLVALVARLMYPYVDPAARTTVAEGIVGTLSLNLVSIGAVFLLPLVCLYFAVLYSAFGGPIEAGEGY